MPWRSYDLQQELVWKESRNDYNYIRSSSTPKADIHLNQPGTFGAQGGVPMDIIHTYTMAEELEAAIIKAEQSFSKGE